MNTILIRRPSLEDYLTETDELSFDAAISWYVKRGIDFVGASVAVLLFGPLMALIAITIFFNGGPVIFAHQRTGLGGRQFRCLKFRTMAPDAEARLAALLAANPAAQEEWERDHKLLNDPRVTRLGAILRETSLDELPQFFNVLCGEMSLVGPRPITMSEIPKYGDDFQFYERCRPGVTGLWQVSGRNDISYPARVTLDSQYARNRSLWLDFAIMFKTFGVVLSKSGAR